MYVFFLKNIKHLQKKTFELLSQDPEFLSTTLWTYDN